MGNTGNKAKRILSTEKDHRILMVGLDNAGKTTILYRIKLNEVITTVPNSLGFQVETIQYKNFSFTIWDSGGQDKIRPLWRHYYQSTNGLVWVIDSTNAQNRFIESKNELHLLMFNEPELQQTIPLLIYANKQDDIQNAMNVDQIIQKLFDFNLDKYPLIILQRIYKFDNYKQCIIELVMKQYEMDDEIEINEQICRIIVDFLPCRGIIGKIGERPFCILPTTALTRDGEYAENIFKGLEWMDAILNPKNDCLIM